LSFVTRHSRRRNAEEVRQLNHNHKEW
jgi:hypothetical protein